MLKIFRSRLRTGRLTGPYPERPDPAPPAFRGRPLLDPARCTGDGACVAACPSSAITLRRDPPASSPDHQLPHPSRVLSPECSVLSGDGSAPAVPPDSARSTQHAALPWRWRLDLARCVFCGQCAAACPTQAITMSREYELAAVRRADLVTTVVRRANGAVVVESGPPSAETLAEDRAAAERGWLRLGEAIRRRLRRSFHIRHMDAGSDNSTDWELNALLGPVYDLQRLGIDVVASPRHADAIFVTGPVTRNLATALRLTYEAMPQPGLVIAAGDEACGAGVLQGSYAHLGGVDRVLPVDVYIPGSPPRPQALIHGLLLALERKS